MTTSKRFLSSALPSFILGLALALGSSYLFAAWSAPTQAPPGGNVSAPINVGTEPQTKQGNFVTNSFLGAKLGAHIQGDGLKVGGTNPIPSAGEQPLKLGVEGATGATHYCDQNGNNCVQGNKMVSMPPTCTGNKALQWSGTTWSCVATVSTPPTCAGALTWTGSSWKCQGGGGGGGNNSSPSDPCLNIGHGVHVGPNNAMYYCGDKMWGQ